DVADQDILAIAGLMKNALGAWDESAFRKKLADHRGHHLLTAKVEGQAVGFKLGYERNEETFYSWLGGARGDFWGLGKTNALMGAQHAWGKMRGYKTIETKTKNRFRAMLILNLRHGFEVVAIETAGGQEPKIVLRKTL
ncbi:MAG TPA: GNAT family N-acetyltransferase, partial [Bdellovibrionales bacterium]|nr:GNAT family N-acetyltransferase [Bdellovibrionales bacterium]